ncbi:TetR/AcrR family transcriptional regulator [Thermogemmatispora sp.]|uniref:TetR/AcrR family transcriptional regulator n=1 Tax=Thermogemmatispora sp. TaxID=1968838 RepID=UPI001DD46689|nr:TetR/AcrR family transcriptional regulator [Thermogemmatispora sp.]MBX5448974.1 TetR/AcrR family transcriptional regulator [Thermogemmatispora sp.]
MTDEAAQPTTLEHNHTPSAKEGSAHPTREKDSSSSGLSRGEMTRQRILEAAEAVFGEQGYYEASISEITRRAGVAQGTFYIYFRTKREIFVELVKDLGRRLREASAAATAGLTNRLEIERQGFAAFFRFAAAHRSVYRIVEEAGRVAPEAAQEYYQSICRGYMRGLRAAMEAGEIRQMDPEALAYALMGIGHFLALRWIIWPQTSAASTAEAASSEAAGQSAGDQSTTEQVLPPQVFATLMDFIAHGLAPTSGADPTPVASSPSGQTGPLSPVEPAPQPAQDASPAEPHS